MADVTITPANVKKVTRLASYLEVQFGETVTEGQWLYRKLTSSQYHKADCETSLATAEVAGMVLTPGDVDQYGFIQTDGLVEVGAVLTQGKSYYLSTAGLMMPVDDIAVDDFISFLGVAVSTSQLDISIKNFGWQKT